MSEANSMEKETLPVKNHTESAEVSVSGSETVPEPEVKDFEEPSEVENIEIEIEPTTEKPEEKIQGEEIPVENGASSVAEPPAEAPALEQEATEDFKQSQIESNPSEEMEGGDKHDETSQNAPEARATNAANEDSVQLEKPAPEQAESDLKTPEVDHEKKVQEFMQNDEKIAQYSDDEISVAGSSSDSDSSSESDSSDSSDSSDESGEDEDEVEEAALDGIDDEEESSGGPIVSKNEQDEKALTLPEDYKVPENAPLEFVGTISSLVERNAIVKANVSGEFRVLKDASVLCFEDKSVLGPLFETFGKLQAPYYRVKFNSDEEFSKIKDKKGAKVFYVVPESQFIYTDSIKKIKGTDASNCHDEELPEEEQEFSDDEQELAAKQSRKKKKKAKSKDNGDEQPAKRQNTRPESTKFTSYGFAPNPSTTYAGLPKIPQTNNRSNPPPQAQPAPSQQAPQYQQAYPPSGQYGVPFNATQHYAPQNAMPNAQQFLPQVPQFQQNQTAYGYPQQYWSQQQVTQQVPQQVPQQYYQAQQPYQAMYQQQPPSSIQGQQYQAQTQYQPQQLQQQYQQQQPQTSALHQLHALVSNQLNQQNTNQNSQHQPQGPSS